MDIKEIKLQLDKPLANENAGGGEQAAPGGKTSQTTSVIVKVAAEAPGPAKQAGTDVVTISIESKSLVGLVQAPKPPGTTEAVATQQTPTPSDPSGDDVNGLRNLPLKQGGSKRGPLPDGGKAVLMEDGLGDPDAVVISKDLKSALKSGLISHAGNDVLINVPRDADASVFLAAVLNGLLPGWNIKVRKVYRRPAPGRKKDSKEMEPSTEDERSEPQAPETSSRPGEKRYECYRPAGVRMTASGIIRSEAEKDLRFRLDLNFTPTDDPGVSMDSIDLGTAIVKYDCDPQESADLGFTFEAEEDENGKTAPFEGTGVGRLIIDLVPVGRTEDGGTVYGLPEE